MADDKAFLEYIVKSLVDFPNDVVIDRTVDEMGVLITMTVNGADMGKIIGRQGNTAKAIRTLLRVIGMKNNARVNLKINEPEVGVQENRPTSGSMSSQGSNETHTDTESADSTYTHVNTPHVSAASRSVDDVLEDLKGI
jgi:predicted RNA-binding protein YlqC (UPF0109 family)